MELSLDVRHRTDVVKFIVNSRKLYDKLLDDSPDIPSDSIRAFLLQFPEKDNKPDVCNGLSIVVDDTDSVSSSKRAVKRWLGAFKGVTTRRKSDDLQMDELHRVDSV